MGQFKTCATYPEYDSLTWKQTSYMQTLPSLDQFRKLNTFVTNKTNIHIRSLKAKNIDVDIYLDSIGENLQRA